MLLHISFDKGRCVEARSIDREVRNARDREKEENEVCISERKVSELIVQLLALFVLANGSQQAAITRFD